jgi:hypothetical protein
MKSNLTDNPPQSILGRMLAFPQNRVFLGLVVRFRLKNYWFIAQSELLAVVIDKLEAGSGKNNVSNTRHRRSQGFESYNLSTVLNFTRLSQQGNDGPSLAIIKAIPCWPSPVAVSSLKPSPVAVSSPEIG